MHDIEHCPYIILCPHEDEHMNDKALSEMSTEEILGEIARLRERRAINRSNALQKKAVERDGTKRAPAAKRGRVIEDLGDDLEALLG